VRQRIRVNPEAGCLFVEISGVFDRVKAKELMRQVFQSTQSQSLSRILVDIRNMAGPIPTMARFEMARFLATEQKAVLRVAVLKLPEQVPDDKFFENVAGNRGIPVKVTTDLEKALDWLYIKAADQADGPDPEKNGPDE